MRTATKKGTPVPTRDEVNSVGFTAMLLVGGRGSRLAAAVADRPKPLALVDGEPFLTRLLDQLAAAGCTRAVLCTGHLGAQIVREFGTEHAGVALTYSQEVAPLGTAGALQLARSLVEPAAVLVMNGDSYCDLDLREFVAWACRRGELPALVAVPVPDTARFGALRLAADGAVLGLAEKGGVGPGVVNAGIYWLPRCMLAGGEGADAAVARPGSFERDVLPEWIGRGLAAFRTEAPFLDIGTPSSYGTASAFFAACAARRQRPRKGLLVVDRDGTLIAERHYLADPSHVELLPGVVAGLRAFAADGYALAIVTNQSGIGRGYFDETALTAVHAELRRQLDAVGITIHGIWHCPHHPEDGCECRKPSPELLQRAMHELGYVPSECLVVGDKACDILLGARLGVRTALVRTGYGQGTERDGLCSPDLIVDDLAALALQEVRA